MRVRWLPTAVALLAGFLLVAQFRTPPVDHSALGPSPDGQATYLSQLYRATQAQRDTLEALQAEIAKYGQPGAAGSSRLVPLLEELQRLRMANGEVELTGPGVQVRVLGTQDVVQVLQDLTNELRNAGAEAVALNQVRLVTRSAIIEDADHHVRVDGQPIQAPYLLEAIGDPASLETALDRKGGLIALLEQAQGPGLQITVTRRPDGATALKLPRAAPRPWHYAQP